MARHGSLGRKMSISEVPAAGEEDAFLSKAAVGPREWALCVALMVISAIVFVVCIPYVRAPVPSSPAFVGVYNAVSTLNDLTTSVILFGQFAILRSRALLLLASGYLFASLISIVQLLTFPGIFTATGLLGAEPQTALWLCVFWHGGFPLSVILYVLLYDDGRPAARSPRVVIASGVVAVIAIILACWFAATWGTIDARVLPPMLDSAGWTPWQRIINLTDILLAVAAFVLLWRRRQRGLLNLWLMVVMSYWF